MISLNHVAFSSRIYLSFAFCSDFNLEAEGVKTDEVRGLKELLTPCFPLNGRKMFSEILTVNYRIAHQKIHVMNNNDRTFN